MEEKSPNRPSPLQTLGGNSAVSMHVSTQRSFSSRKNRMLRLKLFWKLPCLLPMSFEHFSMSVHIESYIH